MTCPIDNQDTSTPVPDNAEYKIVDKKDALDVPQDESTLKAARSGAHTNWFIISISGHQGVDTVELVMDTARSNRREKIHELNKLLTDSD